MASYAHYALQKLHMLPSVFCSLSMEEQAFVIASIDFRIEKEKKEARDAERRNKNRGRKKRR